jgi:FkbM family methyltransferase
MRLRDLVARLRSLDSKVREEIWGARIEAELDELRACYDSTVARIARLEAGRKGGDATPAQGQAKTADAATPSRAPTILSQINAYGHLMRAHDNLRNQMNELLRNVQEERRSGGLRNPTGPVADTRSPVFPSSISSIDGVLPCRIIDVGAQNLTSEGHIYAPLQAAGACEIVGFEPLKDASEKRATSEPGVRMLPYAIGDGKKGVLHVCRFDPASSLLEPNITFLEQFMALPTMCEPTSRLEIETVRLDDVSEIEDCDFIKIDVQGGELEVLKGAPRLLERAIVVHTEAEFAPVYRDQPLFGDIDSFLRSSGFELIDLMKFGYATFKELPSRASASRLMWCDAVYFKSQFPKVQSPPVKLLKAAYIAHVNYGLFDLAANLLAHYDRTTGQALAASYAATQDFLPKSEE